MLVRMIHLGKLRSYSAGAVALVLVHAALTATLGASLRASNVLQLLAVLLAFGFCVAVARRTIDQHLRGLWFLLAIAFGLWSAGQAYFAGVILFQHRTPQYPSAADALWMAFALPILLIVIRQRDRLTDWISWLDAGQAGVFFSLLAVLVFIRGTGLAITNAYDVQGATLVLLCGLQYSRSAGEDKLFFRNLGLYLLAYGVCTSAAYRIESFGGAGWQAGSAVDLCWSIPPCLFILIAERTKTWQSAPAGERRFVKKLSTGHRLYGTSAFGLFTLSLTIGIFLHRREAVLGFVYMGVASFVFAARTIYRDSQIVRANESLRDSCNRDLLTGLPNRFCLMNEAASGITHGSPLLLCNLDRIKLLNESLGRDFVDTVLQDVARRLSCSGYAQEVFRVGGDEFVVVVGDGSAEGLSASASGLLHTIREPVSVRGRKLLLTATIGAPGAADSLDQLLLQAEAAVSFGKQHGRDQFVAFTPSMQRDAAARLELEIRVKQAIDAGHIINYYQAIQCTTSKRIVGFEALARWMEAGRVVASPADFIPVAEDTWMILEMGRKLFSQACEDVLRFSHHAKRPIWVSVNYSTRQLHDPTLLDYIQSVLKRTGVSPSLLKIEVTESFLLDDTRGAVARLQALHDLGLKIAIDDFGTGYSSLSYLATLPFEVLKVDRSFVAGLEPTTNRAKVTRAIVQLAKVLDKEIVAEGVETQNEEEQLIAMGCDYLQGYMISKPVPRSEALALVRHLGPSELAGLGLPADVAHAMRAPLRFFSRS